MLVGGCATELLITDIAAPEPRPTKDVDMVVDVASLADYYKIEEQLREFGFTQSMDDQGVICRWIKNAQQIMINGININHITAPIFIATKLDAFLSRGKADYLLNHDLEDLISVVDGREKS
ncbi:hypothetical protein MNBD_GAMMA25-1231 [hydrothermal vent metagenome]|uniref:Nucleotidyltransferase family protein n=1 Tax=hydrothermal vent metagenome TaxID=652676 RepID=A0A3B1BTQ1_9ZZZZ